MKHVLPQFGVKPSHVLHNIRKVLVKDNLFMCRNSINVIYLQNYKLLTISNLFYFIFHTLGLFEMRVTHVMST